MRSLLIKNCSLLERNASISSKRNVFILDGKIKKITDEPITKTQGEIIDGSKFIVTPSFINAHFHLGETLFCGFAPLDSLNSYIKFTSRKLRNFIDADYETVCQQSILKCIRTGTSAIMAARGWNTVKKSEIKGLLGYPLMNSPKLSGFRKSFATKIGEQISQDNDKVKTCIWVHSIISISEEEWIKTAEIIKARNLRLTLHVAETQEQVEKSKILIGCSEVEFLDRLGLLNEKTNIVHGTYLTNSELKLIAERRVNLTACPLSSFNLHQKLPEINKMLDNYVNVSLATDGLATGGTASILEVAAYASKMFNLSNEILLKMITFNPAKTVGLNNSGELKEGFDADICFFKNTKSKFESLLRMKPIHLIVNGHFVMKNGHVTTMLEETIEEQFEFVVQKNREELIQDLKEEI